MELPYNMGRVQRSQGLKAENEAAETLGPIPKKRAIEQLAVEDEEVEDDENAFGSIGEAKRLPAKIEETAVQKIKRGNGVRDAINRLAALKAKLAKEAADAAKRAADTSLKKIVQERPIRPHRRNDSLSHLLTPDSRRMSRSTRHSLASSQERSQPSAQDYAPSIGTGGRVR